MESYPYPRIRDLPEQEQAAFKKFLWHQTVPLVDNIRPEDQDFYYPWDYENWKRNSKDRIWD